MTEEQIEEFRGALEAEKDSVEEELTSHGRMLNEEGEWHGNSSGLAGEEADPSDAADQIEELVTNVPLVEELQVRHRDIVNALKKIEENKYGVCEVCGEPIPVDRLEANPAARTCIAHA